MQLRAAAAAGRNAGRAAPRHSARDAATADRATTDAADAALYATLNARRAAVDEGAGRRYRVDNASPGFLNVHAGPTTRSAPTTSSHV